MLSTILVPAGVVLTLPTVTGPVLPGVMDGVGDAGWNWTVCAVAASAAKKKIADILTVKLGFMFLEYISKTTARADIMIQVATVPKILQTR